MNLNLIKIAFLIFVSLALIAEASAAVCQNKTVIVYGNGMFNSWDDANRSRIRMRYEVSLHLQAFPSTQLTMSELEFHLAYANDSGGFGAGVGTGLEQLLEMVKQKVAGSATDIMWQWLAGGVKNLGKKAPLPVAIAVDIIVPDSPPAWFRVGMKDISAQANVLTYVNDLDLFSHINGSPLVLDPAARFEGYKYLLNQGQRVVIVAHGEGNFYANRAYQVLVDPLTGKTAYAASIGVVAVATPASEVLGGKLGFNEPYMTVTEDLVVAGVRVVVPTLAGKPANSLWSTNMVDLGIIAWANASTGHNFVNWYLAGTYTRDFIMKGIVDTLNGVAGGYAGLQYPACRSIIDYVKASNASVHQMFGHSLSLSLDGKTMVVGSDNRGAYVFSRVSGGWVEDAILGFGYDTSISADGGTIASSHPPSNSVGIYRKIAGSWVFEATLRPSLIKFGLMNFGESVSLSADGNIIVVGASSEDTNTVPSRTHQNLGAVYTFNCNRGTWIQQSKITGSHSVNNLSYGRSAAFGKSVSLSGDGKKIAVGAPFESDGVNAYSGALYTYIDTNNSGAWIEYSYAQVPGFNAFGASVSLSTDGSTLAAGAVYQNNVSGVVHVFSDFGGGWIKEGEIIASNADAGDAFGYSVSLSADGNILAVGASHESSAGVGDQQDNSVLYSGAAYLFNRLSSNWIQKSYVKATNPSYYNWFGRAVSVSGDGYTLAVSAPLEGGNGSGVIAFDSMYRTGAVYTMQIK